MHACVSFPHRQAPCPPTPPRTQVIAKMELDDKGDWGDVVFIPAGAMQEGQQAQQGGGSAAGGAKKGGKKGKK